jgi:hypothetical protein
MDRLTNIVRRISYQRCNVLLHFRKIHWRFRLQRVFPLNPPRSHPGLVCAFGLDLVGTLPLPKQEALRSIAAHAAEIERRARFFTTTRLCYLIAANCRKRRFTIPPYTSAPTLI